MKHFADKANAVLKAINGLRPTDSNKGTFGHAYIIGGSLQYSGAPYLTYSASSAYRGGIGYAHLALPKSLIPSFMLKDPQAIITPMNEDKDGFLKYDKGELSTICNKAKGIAFGMGVGISKDAADIAIYLLKHYSGVLLFDADALNSIAEYSLTGLLKEHIGQLVLTPHLKEFSRLSGLPLEVVEARQEELAKEYASRWNCVLVLKSHKTYVSDGKETYELAEGNSGLAKAGSGDLLSGLIIGLSWAYPSLSKGRDLQGKKRHPTVEDNVTIYSNAAIFGGETIIGENSVIGGNVYLTHSIPPNSIVKQTDEGLTIIQK